MIELKEIVIVAPYWCDPQHLGHYRVERFIRWLSHEGISIVVVAAANNETCITTEWGKLVTVRDPLGIYGERRNEAYSVGVVLTSSQAKFVVKWRRRLRWLAYALLNPDPGLLWARRAARHPLVLKHVENADAILSSSFPESAHVIAADLASQLQIPLLIDMRDGWLDEPMKPLLNTSKFQRWREGRLEKRILKQARLITVTSEQWLHLLVERLPFTKGKSFAVTNAYPKQYAEFDKLKKPPCRHLNLVYAGRIFSSRAERKIEHLLQPLLHGLRASNSKGSLTFVGDLAQAELEGLRTWQSQFLLMGWEILTRPPVPRQTAIELMHEADGLVLLSSSHASIPAKLFEYICAKHPILAIAQSESAVAKLEKNLPQLFIQDYLKTDDEAVSVIHFIDACQRCDDYKLPIEYSETYTGKQFIAALKSVFFGVI